MEITMLLSYDIASQTLFARFQKLFVPLAKHTPCYAMPAADHRY
jgi:hypothetical protein